MAKFLQLIAPLATAALSPASAVTTPAPHQLTSRLSVPSATNTSGGNKDYQSAVNMSFLGYKDIINAEINSIPNTGNGTLAIWIFGLAQFADKFKDGDFQKIVDLVSKAPFASIADIFRAIIHTKIDDFVNKDLPLIISQSTDNTQLPALASQKIDTIHQSVVDELNDYLLNNPTIVQNDIYQKALSDTGLNTFAQNVKDAGIPLVETDLPKLLVAAAKDVLDERATASVEDFQKALATDFTDTDALINAIVKKIADKYIDSDKIKEVITKEVDDTYNTAEDNIKKFGLEILTTKFGDVKQDYEKVLEGTYGGKGAEDIANDLKDNLENNVKTLADAEKFVDDFKVAKKNLTDTAENLIKTQSDSEIQKMQSDWLTIINTLPANIPYWNAIQARNKMKNPLEAFRALFNDQTLISKFLTDYSSIDPSKQKIENFDFTFNLEFDQYGTPGQRTIVSSSIILSSEVKKAEDGGNNFVPNYAKDASTTWEYKIYKQPVSVSIDDVAKIIADDFKNNSKPSVTKTDDWAINPEVSTLDLDKFWNAEETDANGNATPINQGDFDPEIMTFHTLKDVEELFPRIKFLIENSSLNSDGSHNQVGFSDTLQDALFGANPTADISIDDKPVEFNPGEKITNYNVKLVLTDKSTSTPTTKTVDVQANNVAIYDENLDATVESALTTLLTKTPAGDGESDDAKSFAGLLMGNLWSLPGASKDSDGTFDFKNLYELLNLFFFTGGEKGTTVLNTITEAIEKDLLANDKDVKAAKTALDNNPNDSTLKDALNAIIAEKAKPYLIQNTLVQLSTIQQLNYQKLLGKVNPLQQLDSLEDVVKNIKVSGTLSWKADTSFSSGWDIKLNFTSSSIRWKADNTPSNGGKPIAVAVHQLQQEINESMNDVDQVDKDYKPLLDQLNLIGDIPDDKYQALKDQIQKIKDQFNSIVRQQDTPQQINDRANDSKQQILDAINKALNIQPEDELNDKPPVIPGYINKKEYENAIIKIGKNASSQFNKAYADYRTALSTVVQHLASSIITSGNAEQLITDIKNYIELKGKDKFGTLISKELTPNEKQDINKLEDNFRQAGIYDDIQTLIDPIIKVETIANVVYNVVEESAKISGSDKRDEIKNLATYKIADYLAHADFTDLTTLKNIKDFLKNPLGASQIKPSVPMKATVLALGGFMGLVGLGASFSTLRSVLTNRNLKAIGEGASIEYEKPKKTMAIKAAISMAALASAATIITLVFTLLGGLL